ncbi:hypothetical protein BLFGPEAP_02030 [Candidatus Methanoperedenaceae archaeon GB50]|nr:hypothetical protein BLFGPEAP_02030 [Candidatus Methanoperedenaceae archaeon GB50]
MKNLLEDPLVMIVPKKYNYNDSPLKLKGCFGISFYYTGGGIRCYLVLETLSVKHNIRLSWNKVKIRAIVHCNALCQSSSQGRDGELVFYPK